MQHLGRSIQGHLDNLHRNGDCIDVELDSSTPETILATLKALADRSGGNFDIPAAVGDYLALTIHPKTPYFRLSELLRGLASAIHSRSRLERVQRRAPPVTPKAVVPKVVIPNANVVTPFDPTTSPNPRTAGPITPSSKSL